MSARWRFALASGALSIALAACQAIAPRAPATPAEAPRVASATLERLGRERWRASWVVEPAGTPVTVLLSATPDAQGRVVRILARDDAAGSLDFAAPVVPRPYLLLRVPHGSTRVVAERELPLAGGRNFRDLGGYATADGHHVRWGLLYRSASMGALTDGDLRYLGDLGIRTECDFRSTEERQREPSQWKRVASTPVVEWDYSMASMGLTEILSGRTSPERMDEIVRGFYAALPDEFADRFRRMFAELLAGHAPLAFNCTAGKDRTGVASALLLLALGVPRQTVFDDYLLSNRFLERDRAKYADRPVAMQLLAIRVEAPWLEAALASIEREYGSVDGYFSQRLGLGPAEITALRRRFLE